MSDISVEVAGLAETRRQLENVATGLTGPEMVNAMRRATMLVERAAKRNAPVDTGRLRSSITSAVGVDQFIDQQVYGIVGSNVSYAINQELGTGTFAGRPPHSPPARELEGWARRKGLSAGAVASAISKRGGLRPQPFLQPAFDANEDEIVELIGSAVSTIVRRS